MQLDESMTRNKAPTHPPKKKKKKKKKKRSNK